MRKLPPFFQTKNPGCFKQYFIALVVFISRFFRIMPNFSALGSFGFFQANPVLFFGQIILFDRLYSGFYPGFIFTYLGFAAYYLFGRLAKDSTKKQIFLLPLASFCFFLLSNFGVWLYWYPRTLVGLSSCYLAALPFYRNTLLGDVFFGGLVIICKSTIKSIKEAQISAKLKIATVN